MKSYVWKSACKSSLFLLAPSMHTLSASAALSWGLHGMSKLGFAQNGQAQCWRTIGMPNVSLAMWSLEIVPSPDHGPPWHVKHCHLTSPTSAAMRGSPCQQCWSFIMVSCQTCQKYICHHLIRSWATLVLTHSCICFNHQDEASVDSPASHLDKHDSAPIRRCSVLKLSIVNAGCLNLPSKKHLHAKVRSRLHTRNYCILSLARDAAPEDCRPQGCCSLTG